jgi:hypothetical protein
LTKRELKFNYTIFNEGDEKKSFIFKNPFNSNDRPTNFRIPAKQEGLFNLNEPLDISQLTEKTFFIHLSPYLKVKDDKYKLLLGKYSGNIQIKLPQNAQIVRSSVPFKKNGLDAAFWQFEGSPVLPPIDVWYTVGEEKIKLTKNINQQGEQVYITISITNLGGSHMSNLFLSSRIPRANTQVNEVASDGTFFLAQNTMYLWSHTINNLPPSATKSLRFVLYYEQNKHFLFEPKVRVNNKNGDLLAFE